MRVFQKVLGTFFPVLLAVSTGMAQPCEKLEASAATFADQTSYRAALTDYRKAGECYLAENKPARYLVCLGYEIDCLMKLSAFREMRDALAKQAASIRQYAGQLTAEETARARYSHQTFTALSMQNAGDAEACVALLTSALDSIAVILSHGGTVQDSARTCNLLLFLSEAYLQQGNFESAKTHAYEAVQLARHIPGMISTGVVLRPLMTLAESQFNAGNIEEAEKTVAYLNEVIHSVTARKSERALQVSRSIFNIYLHSAKVDSAKMYLDRIRALDAGNQYSTALDRLSGEYYLSIGAFDAAEQAFRQALNNIIRNAGERTEACAGVYFELGALRLRSQAFAEATQFFHKGIYTLSGAPHTPDDPALNPPLESLFTQRLTLDLLDGKTRAMILQYKASGSPELLRSARNASKLAVEFLAHLRSGYYAESDRATLTDRSYPVYEHALRIVHMCYQQSGDPQWLDTAFVLMEESKALNLRDAILHGQARRFAGIPDSLLQLEHSLKLEIAGKEKLIRDYRTSAFYQPEVEFGYRNELAETRRRFIGLLDIYEKDYPRYYTLKHKPVTTSVGDFREYLSSGQVLLEYFVGDSIVFLLVIGHDRQDLFEIGRTEELQSLVSAHRNEVLHFPSRKDASSLETYAAVATELFAMLIPDNIPGDSDLLIVPDGILGYLSFAGLLQTNPTDLPDIRAYDFLLWHHDLAYSYSANLYAELQSNTGSDAGNMLVCAPDFSGLEGIPKLPYNQLEASRIGGITGGERLTGDACTIQAFRQRLAHNTFTALHLATHGSANDTEGDSSFLVFNGHSGSPPFLYVYDLYNMDLNIPLVYLSACETGTGELRRGEGMISLARGFFYAGVKGLVTTLWRLEDQRAMEISERFYENLLDGMRKDAALANAQRTYLQSLSARDRHFAHPAYWSAIIPVGNIDSVTISSDTGNQFYWYAGIAVLVIVSLCLAVFRRRRDTR